MLLRISRDSTWMREIRRHLLGSLLDIGPIIFGITATQQVATFNIIFTTMLIQ